MDSLQYYSSHDDYCFVCLNCSSEAPLLPRPGNIDEFFAGIVVNVLTPWMCCSCVSVVQAFHESREKAQRAQALLSTFMLNPQLIQTNKDYFIEELNYIKYNVQTKKKLSGASNIDISKQRVTSIKNEIKIEYSDACAQQATNTASPSVVDVKSLKRENDQCSSGYQQIDKNFKYQNKPRGYRRVTAKCFPSAPIGSQLILESDTDVTFDENDDIHLRINNVLHQKIQYKKITEDVYKAWVAKTLQKEEYIKCENKCDKCAIVISHKSSFVQHLKRHNEVTPHRCHLCDQHVESPEKLDAHISNHLCQYVCLLCGEMSRDQDHMITHCFTLHTHINFHCKHCSDAVFRDPMALKKHMDVWHKSQECTICHKIVSKSKIKQHQAAHKASLLKEVFCKICDMRLRDRASLTAHMKVAHSDSIKKEKCATCYQMIKQSSMAAHMEKHEAKLKPLNIDERDDPTAFVCKICNRTVKSERTLEKHYRRHTFKRKWECNDCNKIFTMKSLMRRHIVRIHLRLFKFKCPQCPQMYVVADELNKHIRKRHSVVPPMKNKMCDICGKAFSAMKILENHRLIHTGEKPYSCEQCGRAFRQQNSLQIHIKTVHLGIKYKDLLADRKKHKLAKIANSK